MFLLEPRQGWPWNSKQYPGTDQRPGVAGSPADDRRCGARVNGGSPVSPPAGNHWTVEPRGSDQHILGRQVGLLCGSIVDQMIVREMGTEQNVCHMKARRFTSAERERNWIDLHSLYISARKCCSPSLRSWYSTRFTITLRFSSGCGKFWSVEIISSRSTRITLTLAQTSEFADKPTSSWRWVAQILGRGRVVSMFAVVLIASWEPTHFWEFSLW